MTTDVLLLLFIIYIYLKLEIINRIEAHAGLVKGVAWDPVGVYFASQVYLYLYITKIRKTFYNIYIYINIYLIV